jgi:UDPglucose--hexose-1-phosphate uridylyltransferase
MVAANRQNRPHLPKVNCPFCPGNGNMPLQFDVVSYPNDFPVLSQNPEFLREREEGVYQASEAYGKCEVIIYSSNHKAAIHQLPDWQVQKIIRLWKSRNDELSLDQKLKYIYPFENRGEEVGVTIHHPHGQLYAYSWLPLKLVTELRNAKDYFLKTGNNLFDEMNLAERLAKSRLLMENDAFICYIPYFTDYPFGAFIVSKSRSNLSEFEEIDIIDLAKIIKELVGAFDQLFDREFPYMMVVHQTPVNLPEYADAANYFRFHIEFYTPLRDAEKIKWYASSEMGAWAAANTLSVEDCAEKLRAIFKSNNIKPDGNG